MIDEDFRTKLLSYTAGAPVEKGKVSEDQPQALRVEFERGESNTDTYTSGGAGLTETLFDVEVQGTSPGPVQALVALVKSDALSGGLNGFSGAMGASTVLGCWVMDHDDDYQPKLLDADEGFYVATFRVQVIE